MELVCPAPPLPGTPRPASSPCPVAAEPASRPPNPASRPGARSRRARRAASPRPLPSVHEEPADEPLASAEELRVLGMLLSGDWAKDKKNSSRRGRAGRAAGCTLPPELVGCF